MLFLRVRILRPVSRLGGNYFRDLSVVNGLSYSRQSETSDAKIKAVRTQTVLLFSTDMFTMWLNNVIRVGQSFHSFSALFCIK